MLNAVRLKRAGAAQRWQTATVRRNTAVRNLSKVTATVQDWVTIPAWLPITELWAYGELLEASVDSVEVARVALMVDPPAEEVTWLALPPSLAGFASATRLERLPVTTTWRPAVWPVWNHAIRRPVRSWSLSGPDEAALGALAAGTGIDEHRLADPDPEIYREQLLTELAASLTHLQRVTDSYWEPDWRADHKGCGRYPEDHLWRAAQGYLELRNAIAAEHGSLLR